MSIATNRPGTIWLGNRSKKSAQNNHKVKSKSTLELLQGQSPVNELPNKGIKYLPSFAAETCRSRHTPFEM